MSTKNLLIILLISISCNSQIDRSDTDFDTIYDFEVLYRFQGDENVKDDRDRYKISPDSFYFIFESQFTSDYVSIGTEKKEFFQGVVSTELSTGAAKDLITSGLKKGDDIIIKINQGQPISFTLVNIEHNIIGVRKAEDKVSILFYKKVPSFY